MQRVTQFKSDSGKLFDDEFDALNDDFLTAMQKASGNEAIARAITDAFCTSLLMIGDLRSLVIGLHDKHPAQPRPPAAPTAPTPPIKPPVWMGAVTPSVEVTLPTECDVIGGNTGHGHAWNRPDGVKARCGGPGMCDQCSADQALVERCRRSKGL